MISIDTHEFEYAGESYHIVGMQGCKPLSLHDMRIDPEHENEWRTPKSYAYGYIGTHVVNEMGQLTLKTIGRRIAWKTHKIEVNQIVPLSGHLLLSTVLDVLEVCSHYYTMMGMHSADPLIFVPEVRLFEVEVVDGTIIDIRDCLASVETRMRTLSLVDVAPLRVVRATEEEQCRALWELTAKFLPRPYDIFMYYYNYTCFPSGVPLAIVERSASSAKPAS
jgi:hypothetical protein